MKAVFKANTPFSNSVVFRLPNPKRMAATLCSDSENKVPGKIRT